MGPDSFVASQQWPMQAVEDASKWAIGVVGDIVAFTTNFSGLGTVEAAIAAVEEAARRSSKFQFEAVCWAASDVSPVCQSILCSHVGKHQPTHVFGDITDRLERGRLKELEHIQELHRKEFAEWAHSAPKTGDDSHTRASKLAECSSAFLSDAGQATDRSCC